LFLPFLTVDFRFSIGSLLVGLGCRYALHACDLRRSSSPPPWDSNALFHGRCPVVTDHLWGSLVAVFSRTKNVVNFPLLRTPPIYFRTVLVPRWISLSLFFSPSVFSPFFLASPPAPAEAIVPTQDFATTLANAETSRPPGGPIPSPGLSPNPLLFCPDPFRATAFPPLRLRAPRCVLASALPFFTFLLCGVSHRGCRFPKKALI